MAKRKALPSKKITEKYSFQKGDQSRLVVSVSHKNEGQKRALRTISEHKVTIISGVPGSGKTFLAVGFGLQEMLMHDRYKRIVFVRPIVEAGESLGFLPGDANEKVAPYMMPMYDVVRHYLSEEKIEEMINDKQIVIMPLAYMRGTTFRDSYVVCDECFSAKTRITCRVDGRESRRIYISQLVKKFENGCDVEVLSVNNLGEREWKKVTSVFRNGEKSTVNVVLNLRRDPVCCTKNHPFATWDGEIIWKEAADLVAGDIVLRNPLGKNNAFLIPKENLDILAGFLLGDGCLSRNKSKIDSYRLSKNHGLKQLEYKVACQQMFEGVSSYPRSGYTGKTICGFDSKSFAVPSKFISSIYQHGKKKIAKSIAEWITERSLACWYMDDGSVYHKDSSDYVSLHTEGFSSEENDILIDLLNSKFGLIANKDYAEKKELYYLRFNKENSEKFFNIVREYIHPSMMYKLPEKYRCENCLLPSKSLLTHMSYSVVQSVHSNNNLEQVFNLEVDANNNYFANDILVHNCQNTTIEQMHLLLTRIGEGSKVVVTGDTEQSDLCYHRYNKENGLLDAIARLRGVPGMGFIDLGYESCVREPIVSQIDARYRSRKSSLPAWEDPVKIDDEIEAVENREASDMDEILNARHDAVKDEDI